MSRSTIINEMSKSITGVFQLHDLLTISTLSGSINVTILPQPDSPAKLPAELRLSTASGSIKVTMAPFLDSSSAATPERIFNSTLTSMSGSITAALVHNHQTTLSTMSGDITASLYPLDPPRSTSHIGIRCTSGSASLILHPLVQNPHSRIQTLSADIRGTCGNLKLRFPSTWEGEINSLLSSGRVGHQWEGLRVLKDGSRFKAVSGDGSGRLNVRGSSMNVELVAEKVPGVRRGEDVRDEGERVSGEKLEGEEVELDDGWIVVENEDGVPEATRRPPPSYEDAMRR